MKALIHFDIVDIFSSTTKKYHHIETHIVERGHTQIWFTVKRPRGGMRCLVIDEKLHGMTRMFEVLEKVTSHTSWHNWLTQRVEETSSSDLVALAYLDMVSLRHACLPLDLQPAALES